MRFKHFGGPALLGALALTLSVGARPVWAAPAVDVVYALDDLTLEIGGVARMDPNAFGSMTVRYSNDGVVNHIISGPATVLSFHFGAYLAFSHGGPYGYRPDVTLLLNGWLSSPKAGTLTGGSVLAGLSGWALSVYGTKHCRLLTTSCDIFFDITIASTSININVASTGVPRFTGPIGPYGGAQNTKHVLTGHLPISGVILPGVTLTSVIVEAREIRRTTIPEPSTLPLLAAGAAGLAGLVVYAQRRRS